MAAQAAGIHADQSKRSLGAIGVMQVMPATGKDMKVGDITKMDANIHAGVKYVRFMMDNFYADEPMERLDKGLFTFASYNAGPGRIRQLRERARKRGLDPNKWFGNVERVASEKIGRETVTYVSNIFKYYVAIAWWLRRWTARRSSPSASKLLPKAPPRNAQRNYRGHGSFRDLRDFRVLRGLLLYAIHYF
jgi:membrane-bound lytic murein transglycosylase MltF